MKIENLWYAGCKVAVGFLVLFVVSEPTQGEPAWILEHQKTGRRYRFRPYHGLERII